VFAVIEVLLSTVMLVALVPSNVTVAPKRNPVPVMVIAVPPAVVPEGGEIAVTVGAGLDPELMLNVTVAEWLNVELTPVSASV
jgi:hypothetical protein